MLINFQTLFDTSSKATLSRVQLGSRLAALLVGGGLILALVMMTPPKLIVEAGAIQAVSVATLDRPIVPTIALRQPKLVVKPPPLSPSATSPIAPRPRSTPAEPSTIAQRPIAPDRATPNAARAQSNTLAPAGTPSAVASSSPIPRIATAPSGQSPGQSSPGQSSPGQPSPGQPNTSGLPGVAGSTSGTGTSPRQLGGNSLGIVWARACARLDVRDRPADCPPNDELMRLLAQERGPQYRPENAEGFSRNEQAWRGIPAPCLPNGKNASVSLSKVCVRFGNVPSRVRSVQEICEAKGLGGCAPTPSQASVNAALEQVRRQEAAKARQ